MSKRRWTVVTEIFSILSEDRFTYQEFASLGAAQEARDGINAKAILYGWRMRASLRDNFKKS